MDFATIVMYVGFLLSAYAVVGNDSIQTLGTFLSSNEDRPWWVLWIFAGSILVGTLIYGWFHTVERPVFEDRYVTVDGAQQGGWYIELAGRPGQYLKYSDIKSKVGKPAIYPSEYKKASDLDTFGYVTLPVFRAASGTQELTATGSIALRANPEKVYSLVTESGEVLDLSTAQVHDVSYERLEKYDLPYNMPWYYLLPPLILMLLTRTGIPVSTSFLILTFFNLKNLYDMVYKSLLGYLVAFGVAVLLYALIANTLEKRFASTDLHGSTKRNWVVAQWLSTGFLWSMWLIQDFANIYVYLPRDIPFWLLVVSLIVLLGLLGYIFRERGGKIQEIVKSKSNTVDIRSATIIDFTYGLVLLYFKELNNVPMSTTWVFIGLLAGREIAIRWRIDKKVGKLTWRNIGMDLAKVFFGLAVSIGLVLLINLFR